MQQQIKTINNLLLKQFGVPPRSKKLPNAVDLLIATILSQNTSDKNSYKAFNNLKEKYPKWEDVAALPRKKIEQIIKVAGLGKQKSTAIKNFLMKIKAEKAKISLDYLSKMKNEDILNELTSFSGIGIKTASCVLLFSLDRNICPVDTHVHRTLNRIGLVKTSSPDKTFYAINGKLPKGTAHQFHTNLIRLGREICKSVKPACSICSLNKVCRYESKSFQVSNNYPDKAGMFHKKNSFMLLDEIH